jgi:LysM repeat protein
MAGDFAREQNRFAALPSFGESPAAATTTPTTTTLSYTGGADWAADVAARRSSLDGWTSPATPAPVDTTPRSIEVQAGDSLSRIANRLAGNGASAGLVNDLKNGFIAANPQLSNPNRLQVGQWLDLPRADTVFDNAAFARATAADTQYLAARQPAPSLTPFALSSSAGSSLGFGGGASAFGGPSFLDGLGVGFGNFGTLGGTEPARAPLSAWDRAGAHALGVYDAGVGALDGAAHSFGLVGTPESRAAWAIETSRATIDGLRSFFSDVSGSASRWWSNLTGDDPAAIRQATALPASLGIGLATGYGTVRSLGGGLSSSVRAPLYTERSIFASFPERTALQFDSVGAQADFLSTHIPGLSPTQATSILDGAFTRDSSAVFGGSRVRGNFTDLSDIDVGFGALSERQAQRLIGAINGAGHAVPMERLTIVPGKSTATIPQIVTPEEFFQRSGIRAGGDLKAGQPFFPSGSVTVTGDGRIVLIPPGQ